jgi:hypothetical protein
MLDELFEKRIVGYRTIERQPEAGYKRRCPRACLTSRREGSRWSSSHISSLRNDSLEGYQ